MENKKAIFIGGWTRDKYSYRRLYASAPQGIELVFIPCYEIVHHHNIEDLADGVKNAIETEGVGRVKIVGHSLGGLLAIEYTLKYPDLVEELILIDSSGLAFSQPAHHKVRSALRAQIDFWQYKMKENFNTLFRILRRPIKNWKSLKYAYACNIGDRLLEISRPTQIIWGDQDQVYPLEIAHQMNRYINNSVLKIVEKADHDWIIHSPSRLWENIEL